MSLFYLIKPEVAGGLGPGTVMDRSVHPPVVQQLNYEVTDWLGDCIVTTFPCFLVLRGVASKMMSAGFSGFHTATATISESDEFRELSPDGVLPDLVWLVVDGRPGMEDLGLSVDGNLIVSESVLGLLLEEGFTVGTYLPWTALPSQSPQ